jgi:molybdenum cofactor cytidylyltransferase
VIAAVVLAAGASTRLGKPKQLVVIGGETLLERAVRSALEAAFSPVIVVVHDAAQIEPLQVCGAEVLLNRKSHEGMSTSIHAGVRRAEAMKADGVVLMTCDQPMVTAEHLRWLTASGEVTASYYAGRRGVPAYFPAASFPALMQLTGDTGARELLRGAATVELPGGELDIDTPADLAEAERRFP